MSAEAPVSTSMRRGPWRNARTSRASDSTVCVAASRTGRISWAKALMRGSFVPQGFDGIERGGPPGGIEGREHRKHQCHGDDRNGLAHVHVGGKTRQVIDIGVE